MHATEKVVERQFEILASEWKTATELLSSTSAMISHPAYRGVIALGQPVVPLLLRELEPEPVHWFEALKAITDEDPVPREHLGNIAAMRAGRLARAGSRASGRQPNKQ